MLNKIGFLNIDLVHPSFGGRFWNRSNFQNPKSKIFTRLPNTKKLGIIFLALLILSVPLIYLLMQANSASAAWFDDNWSYRQRIDVTVTSTASDITFLDTLITVDTDDLITAGKLQSSCQDLRFTNTNGKLLPYYIDSGCNGNSTKVWVRADLVPKNSTIYTMYMYYGNPSAVAGSDPVTMNLYNGLKGYWTQNESSWNGTAGEVKDSSINGSNGTANGGATTTTGQYGNAGDFQGTNDDVSIATESNYDFERTQAFSGAAWINPNVTRSGGAFGYQIFSKLDSTSPFPGWEFHPLWDGTSKTVLRVLIFNDNVNNAINVTGTTDIPNSSWIHVAFTYDGSSTAAGVKLYLNGVPESTTTVRDTLSASILNNITPRIGSRNNVNSFFIGQIDDTRVYNRVLSATEIAQLYSNPGSITTTATATSQPTTAFATEEKGPAPTLYWKFDDGQGTTAQDGTTNNLDGTLNNTPTIKTEDFCVAGKCLYFDGANNENVSRADNAALDFVAADNFTVQAWVKRNDASSAVNYILTKAQAGYTGYKLYQDASGDYCFDVSDGTNTDTACTSAVEFDDDKWHLVTGVKAATTSITLYVDGNQRAQDASIAATGTLANTGTFYAGVDLDGTTSEWLGYIDEVKVYRDNTARTAAQVKADYNARSTSDGASQVLGQAVNNNPNALNNGLVGYWKMDESGWTNDCATEDILDSSGNSNNGESCPSTTGPDPASGKFGNAGSFDGTDDYVNVDDSVSLSIAGDITVSAWINLTDLANYNGIFGKTVTNLPAPYDFYIEQTTGKPVFCLGDGATHNCNTSTRAVSTGSWQHVAVTRTGSTVKFYINGVPENDHTNTASSISDANGTLRIGSRADGVTLMKGKIDDARIYNRALSGNEVSQLYNFAPGPVGYWKLDETSWNNDCSTDTVFDSSGNGLNGDSCPASTGPTGGVLGKFNKSGDFDGSNDYLNIGNPTALQITGGLTLEAWIKLDTNNANHNIISKMGASGSYTYQIYTNTSGKIVMEISSNGTTTTVTSGSATTLATGTWYHVAGTYEPSTRVTLYVNGAQETINSSSIPSAIFNSSADFEIGCEVTCAGTNKMDGLIDEPRVYNYVRTEGQVVADMNASHPAPGSPVGSAVAYWKFDEGYSTTANDSNASTGGAENLTQSAATNWTNAGKFGKAYNGATNVRASRTDDDDLDFIAADDFSIAFWFKSDSATNPSDNEYFVEKGGSVATDAVGYAVYTASSGGTVCFGIDDDAVSFPEDSVCSTADIYDATWHHIVAKKTGTTRLDLYVDGRPNGTPDTSISATGTLANAATFFIGDDNSTDGTDEFLGDMDEIKVYRSALTDAQVTLDMNQGKSQVLGALSDNTVAANQVQSANAEYCIPGDSSTCTAPVAEYKMEEASWTNDCSTDSVFDTSGNGLNGDACPNTTGPTGGAVGKFGKGGSFDDTNDYLTMGSQATLQISGDLTLSQWINTPNFNSAGAMFGQCQPGDLQANNCLYYLELTSATSMTYFHENGAGVDTNLVITGSSISANAWHHIEMVRNTTAKSITIYVDGSVWGSSTYTNNPDGGTTTSFYIGADNGTSVFFNGKIDQARVFNYARSAAQVAWDYNQGKPLAHWKMDECQGTVIKDSSVAGSGAGSNGYTGTLTIGASGGEDTIGTCATSSTAWGNGATGKKNYAIDLDGTDDYIDIDSTILNPSTSPFTATAWVNADSFAHLDVDNDTANIVQQLDGTGTGRGWLYIARSSSGVFNLTSFIGGSSTTGSTNWNSLTGTWKHIAITFDGSNLILYVDGKSDATSTRTAESATGVLRLGRHKSPSTTGEEWDGKMDDVRIYNYALTLKQVQTVMNEGALRYGPSSGAP